MEGVNYIIKLRSVTVVRISSAGMFQSRTSRLSQFRRKIHGMIGLSVKHLFLSVFFIISVFSRVSASDENGFSPNERQSKFFPFFLGPALVRFPNEPCVGESGLKGTCYSRHECHALGGFSSGVCAKGLGCCCIIKRTCGETTKANCTYFSNPEYPDRYSSSANPCTLTVWKCNSEVCQIRLDFLDFNLAEPDGAGNCVNDFLLVTGSGTNFRRICGLNTGQHVYVDFVGDAPLKLVIDTNSVIPANRKWNIKVTQVKCCDRAPVGCLMHYTATSGKVMSFNYAPTESTQTKPDTGLGALPGNRQLANLNYGVCIDMIPGYCTIEWTQSATDKYSFTVSSDTNVVDPADLGTPGASETENCNTNFVIIPNPMINGMAATGDRFCGSGFPIVTSSSKPFVLTVVTDGDNPADTGNRGFCLNYRQLPCV